LLPFLRLCFRTYSGRDLTVDLKALPAPRQIEESDLLIFGHQPWFLTMSQPLLFKSDVSQSLRNKKVVSVITTRETWKRTYNIFEQKVRGLGGEVIQSLAYGDPDKPPRNMVSAVCYLLTGKDLGLGSTGRYFKPFGLAPETLHQVRRDASALAERLAGIR
jgi:hypothetical protein